MKKQLILVLALAALAAFTGLGVAKEKKADVDKQAGSPCAVLSTGGTVRDPSQCAELARTGSLLWKGNGARPTLILKAGRTTEWQLVAKNKGRKLADVPVVLISKKDHKTILRTKSDAKGRFRFSAPSGFHGPFESHIDEGGYCFQKLESDEAHLEDICEDDYDGEICPSSF